MKRSRKENAKARGVKVPVNILVQRMSSTLSGRLKKYDPLDTRDFVPFGEYEELSLENIKEACERYYNSPENSCDVLASERGPSCTKMEQVKGKKVYYIRFVQPQDDVVRAKKAKTSKSEPISPSKKDDYSAVALNTQNCPTQPKTVYPKSISLENLLRAGKLVKPPEITTLKVEAFDVGNAKWVAMPTIEVEIEQKSFAGGAFRDAYKAKCVNKGGSLGEELVVKKYSPEAIKEITETLKVPLKNHTKKQVQMHSVAKSITARFASKVPVEFGQVLYSEWNDTPVTVEEFVPGDFVKYINNDGDCVESPDKEYDEIFEKAHCLVHFSYLYSKRKLMILDVQGSKYQLYDPEIVTTDLFDTGEEFYFCAGNLSEEAIECFKNVHKCNRFCKMLELEALV